jgi:hypothetical protein
MAYTDVEKDPLIHSAEKQLSVASIDSAAERIGSSGPVQIVFDDQKGH